MIKKVLMLAGFGLLFLLPGHSEVGAYHFLQTSQGNIAYLDSGGDGFPVVLIHGNSCSSQVFQKQFTTFGPRYRLIAIDLPGHGKSDNALDPESAYNIP